MKPLFEARDLRKYYGGELVLDIPHFQLERQALLLLEGANGSGKSTFLRLLAFLEEPSSGQLLYNGPGQPRANCTLLLQEPWLMHESVFYNVTLGLKLRGLRIGLEEKYQAAMLKTGFKEPEAYKNRRPSSLSGGERQRVALASRLIIQPLALLLDEPTAHVDRASARHILDALLAAREQGMTIVCATHDPLLAESLEGRRMLMQKPDSP